MSYLDGDRIHPTKLFSPGSVSLYNFHFAIIKCGHNNKCRGILISSVERFLNPHSTIAGYLVKFTISRMHREHIGLHGTLQSSLYPLYRCDLLSYAAQSYAPPLYLHNFIIYPITIVLQTACDVCLPPSRWDASSTGTKRLQFLSVAAPDNGPQCSIPEVHTRICFHHLSEYQHFICQMLNRYRLSSVRISGGIPNFSIRPHFSILDAHLNPTSEHRSQIISR